MAKYSRKEFVEKLCGVEYSDSWKAKVSVWIKRGNIDIGNDGLIDDSISKNSDWAIKQYESNVGEVEDDTYDREEHKPKSKPHPKEKSNSADNEAGYVLVKKKTLRQIEKLESDIRIANLKEEKIRGEVLPVDLIKTIFTVHSQSILTSFKDSIEDILIGISKKCDMSSENLAKSRELMINSLNNAVDKSVDASKRQLKSIIEEFSIKKEVGEHE